MLIILSFYVNFFCFSSFFRKILYNGSVTAQNFDHFCGLLVKTSYSCVQSRGKISAEPFLDLQLPVDTYCSPGVTESVIGLVCLMSAYRAYVR